MLTLDSYNKLNNSFNRKLVFHLGCDGGFFSEYNNMILVMLYCLRNQIRFTLYSKDASFGYKNGWADYFLPFCTENRNPLHGFFNMRFPHKYQLFIWAMNIFRNSLKNTLLTSDVFTPARAMDIRENIRIPGIQLEGNLRDICRELIQMTWRYNPETGQSLKTLVASLHIPEKYVGFHIRGGDKFIEAKRQNIDIYISKAEETSALRSAFVLTDDYGIIESLRETYTKWEFYTLCEENERGYFHKNFRKEDSSEKQRKMANLFASVDILAGSEAFIGTFSSNPGMYLGMRMQPEKTFSIDIPDWTIW